MSPMAILLLNTEQYLPVNALKYHTVPQANTKQGDLVCRNRNRMQAGCLTANFKRMCFLTCVICKVCHIYLGPLSHSLSRARWQRRSHTSAGADAGVSVHVTGTPAENSTRKRQHLIIRQF